MFHLIYLINLILVSILSFQVNSLPYIVRGTKAKRCEFPHIVFLYIEKDGKYFGCGGSLVDNKHVVTAAHCVAQGVSRIDVLIGSLDKRTMPTWIPVIRFLKNKYYKKFKSTVINDIAVLTLAEPVTFTLCIKPIRMANPDETFVGQCTIAGWGRIHNNLPTSNVLLRADIPLMSQATCSKYVPLILKQHICGGSGIIGDKTTCKGDSGGPLMCTSAIDGSQVLAGVVSYGWNCNTGLAVFSNVSYFLPWINVAREVMP